MMNRTLTSCLVASVALAASAAVAFLLESSWLRDGDTPLEGTPSDAIKADSIGRSSTAESNVPDVSAQASGRIWYTRQPTGPDELASLVYSTYQGAMFTQDVGFYESSDGRVEYHGNLGESYDILIRNREKDPTTGEEWVYSLKFSSTKPILDFVARSANDFIVALGELGSPPTFERWYLQMPTGSWDATRPFAAVGGLYPPTRGATRATVVGGNFVPPGDRHALPNMRRFAIDYTPLDPVTAFGVDPDARFILVAQGNTLESVDMTTGAVVTVIPPGALVMQGGAIVRLEPLWNPTFGRFFQAERDGGLSSVLIFDADNDGAFEGFYEPATILEGYELIGDDVLPSAYF